MGFLFFRVTPAPRKTAMADVLEIDARNTFCPVPIMRLAARIKQVEIGDVIRVLATDPGFKPDLHAWLKGTRHELVSFTHVDKVLTAEIRKTR